MTKAELEQVNKELLAAATAALSALQESGPFAHQEVRVQLSAAISRATMNPKNWFLIDSPKQEVNPEELFAAFKD